MIWNYGLRSKELFVRSLSGNVVISNCWHINAEIHKELLTGSGLIRGNSFCQYHHSLELSIISVVAFIIDSRQVQISTSLVYFILVINYCQYPKCSFWQHLQSSMLWTTSIQHILPNIWLIFCMLSMNFEFFLIM